MALLTKDLYYIRANESLAMNRIAVQEHAGKTIRELLRSFASEAEEIAAKVIASRQPATKELRGETPATGQKARSWDETWFPSL